MLWRTAALILIAVLPSACATQTLQRKQWYRIVTPSYEVVSSLRAPATLELANDLERFRAAVQFVDGRTPTASKRKTRVYAFDGRAIVRPFDVRALPAYFLPSPADDILVFRTGDGFRDASLQLREELAHHILREARGFEMPLWYEEGVAQLAATAKIEGRRVKIGIVNDGHVNQLRDHDWSDIDRMLQTRDLDGRGKRRRANYSSEAWVLLHYLFFGSQTPQRVQKFLGRVLVAYAEAPWEPLTAERLFQIGAGDVERQLQRYARRERFGVMEMLVSDWRDATSASGREPVPIEKSEALLHLGHLSNRLLRGDQARGYLEKAVALDPENPRILQALGTAHSLEGEWELAEERTKRALTLAPSDVHILQGAGDVARRRASAAEAPAERREILRRARDRYRRAGQLAPNWAGPLAGFGLSYVVDGEDPNEAAEPLVQARERKPESLEAALWLAEARAKSGQKGSPRHLAQEVLSRTHHYGTRVAAQSLADWVNGPREEEAPWIEAADQAPWAR